MPDYVPIQDLTIASSIDDDDMFPMSDGSGAYAVKGSTIKSYSASAAVAAAADAASAKTAAQSSATAAGNAQTASEAAQSAAESAAAAAAAAVSEVEDAVDGLEDDIDALKQALEAGTDILLTNARLTISGYYLGSSGNVPVLRANNSFSVSDFIDISGVYKVVVFRTSTVSTGAYAIQFFRNADMTAENYLAGRELSGITTETNVIIPAGARYLRFCGRNSDSFYGTCLLSVPDLTSRQNITDLQRDLVESAVNKADLEITGRRKELNTALDSVAIPDWDYLDIANLKMFSDGYKYSYICDLSKNKNQSANIFDAYTQSDLVNYMDAAAAGDTIRLHKGTYEFPTITKSINIIGVEKDIYCVGRRFGAWATTAMTDVYKASFAYDPIGAYQIVDGSPIPLHKVSAVGSLASEGTYRYVTQDNALFVHTYGGNRPLNDVFVDTNKSSAVPISIPTGATANIYLENLFVWGDNTAIHANSNGENNINLFAKNCTFWHSNKYNVVSMAAGNGYFQNCDASYGYRDGFNYHRYGSSYSPSNGLELNCIAHDNGKYSGSTENSNNGSTCHDGGLVLRINGTYYRNYGGNLAETNAGTTSYNYGCIVFDSRDNYSATWNADFWCGDHAIQYVFGCIMDGDSNYGMSVVSGNDTVIYYDAYTKFTATNGNVVAL